MTEINLNDLYFKWICSMIFPDENTRNNYSNVLHLLYNTTFEYILALDENRKHDGIDLRYHFSCECKIPFDIINISFNPNECSVLEMMASLAKRCDNNIMYDIKYGDRTALWFQIMFENLGLNNYSDFIWNINSYYEVKEILRKFTYREYESNGSNGGLFIINSPYYDMRNIQIWDQMCIYMNEKYD